MTTTTSYGTWSNRVSKYSPSPESDILDYINGGDAGWRELLEETGALELIQNAYREAIDDALPPGVHLCGDEFIGPAYPDEGEFDGHPTDDFGKLDFKAIVQAINLDAIVDRHDPINLEHIGRQILESQAKDPAKAAAAAMSRLGIKPVTYRPHPESKRPQAWYLTGEVREALKSRPGRGHRSDKKGQA